MDGHVVIKNRAISGTNRVDSLDLKCMAFQVLDGAAKYVVRFPLELRSGTRGAFLRWKDIGVETIRAGVISRVFFDKLNVRVCSGSGRRSILKPAARRE